MQSNSRLLKLAIVTRRYPPLIGGAEKVLSYLAHGMALEGADVTVLTSRIPGLELDCTSSISSNNFNPPASPNPGRLKIVRLETSSRRFWGTCAICEVYENGFAKTI